LGGLVCTLLYLPDAFVDLSKLFSEAELCTLNFVPFVKSLNGTGTWRDTSILSLAAMGECLYGTSTLAAFKETVLGPGREFIEPWRWCAGETSDERRCRAFPDGEEFLTCEEVSPHLSPHALSSKTPLLICWTWPLTFPVPVRSILLERFVPAFLGPTPAPLPSAHCWSIDFSACQKSHWKKHKPSCVKPVWDEA
jgi:hypothetical protein